jgi:uncharacterized membrane protein YeaQ/YmgE (transglycosylase-associated protein family)
VRSPAGWPACAGAAWDFSAALGVLGAVIGAVVFVQGLGVERQSTGFATAFLGAVILPVLVKLLRKS